MVSTQPPKSVICLFCKKVSQTYVSKWESGPPTKTRYTCSICGTVRLEEDAYDDFEYARFSHSDEDILRIVLRNEHEMRGGIPSKKALTIADFKRMVDQYKPLDPLVKIDNALINIKRKSECVGEQIRIALDEDYPYYHCKNCEELQSILELLNQDNLITFIEANKRAAIYSLSITVKGYRRLRDIEKPGKNSRQCFVAMWFAPEMIDVYEKAIKTAIEFKEKGEQLPRYEAMKIDNFEHINDINDEIIAQIRRSKFMICDLTGYRGGVYFEAGFAYGLGLDVIYTCRKDWSKDQILTNDRGERIETLNDENGNKVKIKKEGVHFDLAHRNRIEWSFDNLEDFRVKLEQRIKATII